MDWEINQIEKYFLNNKDSKDLYTNIENLSSKDLREIVNNSSK